MQAKVRVLGVLKYEVGDWGGVYEPGVLKERLSGLQVRVPLEEPPLGPDLEEEDDDLGKTLAVSRFGDLISKTPAWDPEKPSRSYSERDFECG